MNAIIDYIKAPQFWFCTVIIGILINVASHALIQKFPAIFSKFSQKWSTRNTKLKEESEKRIAALTNNPHEQQIFLTLAVHQRVMALISMVMLAILIIMQNFGIQFGLELQKAHKDTLVVSISIGVNCFSLFVFGVTAFGYILGASRILREVTESRERSRGIKPSASESVIQ